MACSNPACLGNYDFDRISYFARKRFIDGCSTVDLLNQASCDREREEIVLVSLLDVEDHTIHDLELSCKHADTCLATDCRQRLRQMISEEMN